MRKRHAPGAAECRVASSHAFPQVVTLDDYNKYCYYVAGLVGVGLSRLFAAGGAHCSKSGAAASE